jgi:hypothetical protein
MWERNIGGMTMTGKNPKLILISQQPGVGVVFFVDGSSLPSDTPHSSA